MVKAWSDQSLLDRMVSAVVRVRNRLTRSTVALEAACVPYAVVGDQAVIAWAATVDPTAVRDTPNVDILLRRTDLDAAERALAADGFKKHESSDATYLLDKTGTGPRDAVRIYFANEKVRPDDESPAPDVTDSVRLSDIRVISLVSVARMTLISNRINDNVNLRDLIDVGLIDASWPARFATELAARLQLLVDTPEG